MENIGLEGEKWYGSESYYPHFIKARIGYVAISHCQFEKMKNKSIDKSFFKKN